MADFKESASGSNSDFSDTDSMDGTGMPTLPPLPYQPSIDSLSTQPQEFWKNARAEMKKIDFEYLANLAAGSTEFDMYEINRRLYVSGLSKPKVLDRTDDTGEFKFSEADSGFDIVVQAPPTGSTGEVTAPMLYCMVMAPSQGRKPVVRYVKLTSMNNSVQHRSHFWLYHFDLNQTTDMQKVFDILNNVDVVNDNAHEFTMQIYLRSVSLEVLELKFTVSQPFMSNVEPLPSSASAEQKSDAPVGKASAQAKSTAAASKKVSLTLAPLCDVDKFSRESGGTLFEFLTVKNMCAIARTCKAFRDFSEKARSKPRDRILIESGVDEPLLQKLGNACPKAQSFYDYYTTLKSVLSEHATVFSPKRLATLAKTACAPSLISLQVEANSIFELEKAIPNPRNAFPNLQRLHISLRSRGGELALYDRALYLALWSHVAALCLQVSNAGDGEFVTIQRVVKDRHIANLGSLRFPCTRTRDKKNINFAKLNALLEALPADSLDSFSYDSSFNTLAYKSHDALLQLLKSRFSSLKLDNEDTLGLNKLPKEKKVSILATRVDSA